MTLAAEKGLEHIGETKGCEDHDFDLVCELGRRLESLWRCDQHIANANGHTGLQAFWRDIKHQNRPTSRSSQLIGEEVKKGCF